MRNLNIIGIGMGNIDTMTITAEKKIQQADLIIGAERICQMVSQKYNKKGLNLIKPLEILEAIKNAKDENIVVIMSGDTGFYSGAKRLGKILEEEGYAYEVLPGISSLQYFASKLKISWNDIKPVTLHGRDENPLKSILNNEKTFFLLGNNMQASTVCKILWENNLGDLNVSIGENLSYENERILSGRAKDFVDEEFDNLSVMLVENPVTASKESFQYRGIADDQFIRGNIPMTKSEVRAVTLAKIAPKEDDIIWDIGAGTGSVTVELAMAVKKGHVVSVECKEEGVSLINENIKKFNLQNVTVLHGMAPEILEQEILKQDSCYSRPDKVFVGGSRGNLREIFERVFEKNSKAKIVINAVTMETVADAVNLIKEFQLENVDICQINVAKTHQIGKYQMLQGASPVYIFSGQGVDHEQ